MVELEERKKKADEDEEIKAGLGKKEFISRERAQKAQAEKNIDKTDEDIVHSLYSLEVKLKVG